MASRWGNNGNSDRLYFLGLQNQWIWSDCSHEIKRALLLGRKAMTNLYSILKSRDIICWQRCPSSQSYGFSSTHVYFPNPSFIQTVWRRTLGWREEQNLAFFYGPTGSRIEKGLEQEGAGDQKAAPCWADLTVHLHFQTRRCCVLVCHDMQIYLLLLNENIFNCT